MIRLLVIGFFFSINIASAKEKDTKWAKMTFYNGVSLKVEVADTFEKRTQGLMFRTELPKDQGMLFIFQKEKEMSFWMRNTYLALSIAYFDKNKKLRNIHQMEPQNMLAKEQHNKTYPSKGLCLYALEVHQGWFKKNKIKPGMKFSYEL